MRPRYVHLLATLGALSAGACHDAAERARDAPSLILISVDTLRADHLGLYGYGRDTSPSLDRLAAESLVFERAHTTDTWTPVAHMSLLTGLYPTQHGVLSLDATLGAGVPTLAERLRDVGYRTLGTYGDSMLEPRFGFARGFERYEPHRDVEEAGQLVAEWLARRSERPFFLFVHLYDVHNVPRSPQDWTIYDPPPPYDTLFVPDARQRVLTLDTPRLWNEYRPALAPAEHEAIVALYDGGVRRVDDALGRWIEAWRADGLLDRTLLVVTADHGEGLAQHDGDRYGGHGAMFQEGLHVPLLLRFPDGSHAGERRADPVSLVDLLPTLEAVLDLAPEHDLPGRSLLAPPQERRLLFAENGDVRTLLRWPWKVIETPGLPEGLAFDLEEDPEERHSIRSAHGLEAFLEVAEPLRAEADRTTAAWARPDRGPRVPPDVEAATRLRALGYDGPDDAPDRR